MNEQELIKLGLSQDPDSLPMGNNPEPLHLGHGIPQHTAEDSTESPGPGTRLLLPSLLQAQNPAGIGEKRTEKCKTAPQSPEVIQTQTRGCVTCTSSPITQSCVISCALVTSGTTTRSSRALTGQMLRGEGRISTGKYSGENIPGKSFLTLNQHRNTCPTPPNNCPAPR